MDLINDEEEWKQKQELKKLKDERANSIKDELSDQLEDIQEALEDTIGRDYLNQGLKSLNEKIKVLREDKADREKVSRLESRVAELENEVEEMKSQALKQSVKASSLNNSEENEVLGSVKAESRSKKQKIIELDDENPALTHQQIADMVGSERTYVSKILGSD
ncbi:MAG: hypothetical protein R6V35_03680 [Candidatus Nanohaloarchaea archaeon]